MAGVTDNGIQETSMESNGSEHHQCSEATGNDNGENSIDLKQIPKPNTRQTESSESYPVQVTDNTEDCRKEDEKGLEEIANIPPKSGTLPLPPRDMDENDDLNNDVSYRTEAKKDYIQTPGRYSKGQHYGKDSEEEYQPMITGTNNENDAKTSTNDPTDHERNNEGMNSTDTTITKDIQGRNEKHCCCNVFTCTFFKMGVIIAFLALVVIALLVYTVILHNFILRHSINDVYQSRNELSTLTPTSTTISNLNMESFTLYPSWNHLTEVDQNKNINITWRTHDTTVLHLEKQETVTGSNKIRTSTELRPIQDIRKNRSSNAVKNNSDSWQMNRGHTFPFGSSSSLSKKHRDQKMLSEIRKKSTKSYDHSLCDAHENKVLLPEKEISSDVHQNTKNGSKNYSLANGNKKNRVLDRSVEFKLNVSSLSRSVSQVEEDLPVQTNTPDAHHSSVNSRKKSPMRPIKSGTKEVQQKLNFKNFFNRRCILQQIVAAVIAGLMIFTTFIVANNFRDKESISLKTQYNENNNTVLLKNQRVLNKQLSLRINWPKLDTQDWNTNLKIPLVVHSPFVTFDEAFSCIVIKKRGTYSFFLTVNLDTSNISRYVNDNDRFKSLVCLRNSRDNDEQCQRLSLPRYTAVTVNIQSTVYLLNGDRVWVSVFGVRQIYRSNAGNRLNVVYSEYPNG